MAEADPEEKYPSKLKTHLDGGRVCLVDPGDPGDYEFICYGTPFGCHGKWMIFKHFDELKATWTNIKGALDNDTFTGRVYLKTTTKVYRPGSYGPGPCTTGVIEVYTGEDNRDEVGKQICMIVKHDIMYKTEQATAEGIYSNKKDKRPSDATMLYNEGNPHLMRRPVRRDLGYSRDRPDEWKLNVVMGPHYFYGKWVLQVTKEDATGVWHTIRREVESGKQKILKLECPSNTDRDNFLIHVYTTEEEWESVGEYLSKLMEQKISYEYVDKQKENFVKDYVKAKLQETLS